MPKACLSGVIRIILEKLLKASACVIICNCDVLKRIIITKKIFFKWPTKRPVRWNIFHKDEEGIISHFFESVNYF